MPTDLQAKSPDSTLASAAPAGASELTDEYIQARFSHRTFAPDEIAAIRELMLIARPSTPGLFPGVIDHACEALVGSVIRRAVEHNIGTMRFYLTCSIGELAQRVVVAMGPGRAARPDEECAREKMIQALTDHALLRVALRADPSFNYYTECRCGWHTVTVAPWGEWAEHAHAALSATPSDSARTRPCPPLSSPCCDCRSSF